MRNARGVPSVDVTSFGGVTIEGGVPEGRGGLPMPLSGVPREVLDKARFEDPKRLVFSYLRSSVPWRF